MTLENWLINSHFEAIFLMYFNEGWYLTLAIRMKKRIGAHF